jgi:hypothetical protein
MQMKQLGAAVVIAGTIGGACGLRQTDVPALAGPSVLASNVTITATPDAISQDGASQSSILVTVLDTSGRPVSGQSIRLEMRVGATIQDFGTLSTKNIVTGSDGKANAVYTAPTPPAPNSTIGTCATPAGTLSGPCVTIVATATGTNSQAAASQTVNIRLVPPGVILPPVLSPKAIFSMVPAGGVGIGQSAAFDGSASCARVDASGNCTTGGSISSFTWNFGDGSAGSGMQTAHAFSTAGTFVVTLTVINDTGGAASAFQAMSIAAPAAPTADFTVSPTTASVLAGTNTLLFNADTSTSAPGHNIVQFNWNFGDPAPCCGGSNTASGITVAHTYLPAGTYTVVLTVMDDVGQKATKSTTVTINP